MSTTLSASFLLLLAAYSSFLLAVSADDSGTSKPKGQDYGADDGGECGGQYQSPVNIIPRDAVFDSQYANLSFHGYNTAQDQVKLKLENIGITVQVSLVNNTNLIGISRSGLPDTYNLAKFNFHWGSVDSVGSEHTLNGRAYPMEIDLIHYRTQYGNFSNAEDKTNGLAILAVFATLGNENNTGINELLEHFGQIEYKDDEVNMNSFPMEQLLPNQTAEYFTYYNGSLTSPPCYQSAIWMVFRDPITITKYQLRAFRKLYNQPKGSGHDIQHIVNNFRPTKRLHGRIVYKSYKGPAVATTTPAGPPSNTTDVGLRTTTVSGTAVFHCSTFVLMAAFVLSAMMAV